MEHDKKVAVVTGAARGIGKGIAHRLVREGYEVVICNRDMAAIEQAIAESATAQSLTGILMDVSDEASVREGMSEVSARFGRLDVLVNSAGVLGLVDNRPPAVEDTPLDLWNKVLSINLTGPFLTCRHALPIMRQRKWGRIVNIASRAARVRSGDPAYAASKGGLLTFSRYLAGEVAKYGITVNSITPSRVQTPMTSGLGGADVLARKIAETPLGRIGTVEDMAGAVAFLVSDDASFMTGAILDVNGGSFMQ